MSASQQSNEPVAHSACLVAAGLLAVAGGLHLAALPGHLDASTVAGTFFAVTAVAQLLGAIVLATRPSSRTLLAVIAGNVAVLTLWAMSRTTGLPTGGELGVQEPFGLLDGFAAAAEILVVVIAGRATMVHRVKGAGRRSGGRRLVFALGLTWVISGGAGLAVADVDHHHGDGHAHSGTTDAPVGSGHSHDTSILVRPVTVAGCPAGHDCTKHSH